MTTNMGTPTPDLRDAQDDVDRADEVAGRVEQALTDDARLCARDIVVDVHGTELTLHGRVQSWSERSSIGEVAWNTPGISAVFNDLTID